MMTKLWMEHRFNSRVIKKCMYSAKSYKIIFVNTSVSLHRLCHKNMRFWLIWLPEWLDQWDQQRKEDVPLHGYAQRWIQCTKTMMAETRADAKTTHTHKKVWINSDPSCCDDTTPTMESWKPPCRIWLVLTLAWYLTACAFLHACVFVCVCLIPVVRFIGFGGVSCYVLCGTSGFDSVSLCEAGNAMDWPCSGGVTLQSCCHYSIR